ncbi:hypothetical protein AVEN_275342-1 [Araneus ventricosus]|uniref:HTH CENPB-type domain-containing protein n=1 Tax=Araneus ventricosus TaxID=182803 RepID=A0A4Y2MVX0_ARAVE|nr:hypothetical protein AVEN_275342-1 [Araneus ventricosus]
MAFRDLAARVVGKQSRCLDWDPAKGLGHVESKRGIPPPCGGGTVWVGQNVPVPALILKEKAVEIAEELNIEDVGGGNGWPERFKDRHCLSFKTICGEEEAVEGEAIEAGRTVFSRTFYLVAICSQATVKALTSEFLEEKQNSSGQAMDQTPPNKIETIKALEKVRQYLTSIQGTTDEEF